MKTTGTLAAEIRLIASNPPIIATVTRPERVLLEGNELSDYLALQQEVLLFLVFFTILLK